MQTCQTPLPSSVNRLVVSCRLVQCCQLYEFDFHNFWPLISLPCQVYPISTFKNCTFWKRNYQSWQHWSWLSRNLKSLPTYVTILQQANHWVSKWWHGQLFKTENELWWMVKLMFQTWGLKYPNVLKRYYKSYGIFKLTLNGPETSCLQEKRKEFFLLLLDPCQFISRHHLSHGA